MEESKHCTDGDGRRRKCACGAAPFLAGLVIALAFGWWIFPDLMFSKKNQPFFFSHKAHIEKADLSCDTCHTFRADGSFTGIPTLDTCMDCHADPDAILTSEPEDNATAAEKAEYKAAVEAEKTFNRDHVATGAPIPWRAHQKQPDNVFFSHAAHFEGCYTCHRTMQGRLNLGTPEDPQKLCMTCHPSLEALDRNIPVEENVLTTYSRTTMKMADCEHCHAHPGHFSGFGPGRTSANNACFTCHK